MWLQPLAWWGLAAVAVPVLVHLLTRQRAARTRFPSLRFLTVSRTTALRRRVISDWPLLLVRGLILVLATAALAAPVFVSAARREAWNNRVARAVVVAPSRGETGPAVETLATEEARGVFAFARFSDVALPDSIRAAVRWFERQPPAAREVVIVGDVREGDVTDADVQLIPPFVGIRILPIAGRSSSSATRLGSGVDVAADAPQAYHVRIDAEESGTRVRYEPAAELDSAAIQIVASARDQMYADAVLRAVLREGVWLDRDRSRRLTIAYRGAAIANLDRLRTPAALWMREVLAENPGATGGELDGALLVRVDREVTDVDAVSVAADVIGSAFRTSFDSFEPRRIPASTIATWSRPAGPVPPDARPANEGDGRWLWMAALALLLVEHIMRRERRIVADTHSTNAVAEDSTRVA